MSDTSVGLLLDKCLALQYLDITGCLRVSDLPLLSLASGLTAFPAVSCPSLFFPHLNPYHPPSSLPPTPHLTQRVLTRGHAYGNRGGSKKSQEAASARLSHHGGRPRSATAGMTVSIQVPYAPAWQICNLAWHDESASRLSCLAHPLSHTCLYIAAGYVSSAF